MRAIHVTLVPLERLVISFQSSVCLKMVLGILLWQLWLAAISVPTRSHKVGFQCTLSTARIEILTEIHQLRDFNRSAIYILTKIQPTSTFFWFQQRIVRPSHLGSPCGPRRFTFRPWLSEVTPIGIRKVWFLKHGISLIHIKHINLRIYIYIIRTDIIH